MEKKIEYVLYKNEINNEYINKLKPIDSAVKKIIKTSDGIKMEEFYNFTKYKNVRTLYELSNALAEDEYLIIDLNEVQKRDAVLHEKMKETINPNHIITYVTHDLTQETNTYPVGEKLYLVKYDEVPRNIKTSNDSFLTQVIMNEDQTCNWARIYFTSNHTRELDERLAYTHGGFSGLYYFVPKDCIDELNTYYEITKVEDGKWDFIKMNKSKNK